MTAQNAASFESCYANWSDNHITVGNGLIERRWRIGNGLLFAESLRDVATGQEWIARPARQPAPTPPGALPEEPRAVSISWEGNQAGPLQVASLQVTLRATGESASLLYHFQVFPHSSAVTIKMEVLGLVGDALGDAGGSAAASSGIELADLQRKSKSSLPPGDLLETLDSSLPHLRLTQVEFRDQSDDHNELVLTQQWLLHPNELNLPLQGNLFVLEDTLSHTGLIFLKHAPLPHARPCPCRTDFLVNGRAAMFLSPKQPPYGPTHPDFPLAYQFALYGHGLAGAAGEGYAWTIVSYSGGSAGMTGALQTYQRQFRPYRSGRDGIFLSNTWGDRSQDSRINETFMLAEVQAAAKLGVDVVQIDDGWQKGRTANSVHGGVWIGYWANDAEFWKVDPVRLPHGLEPLVSEARKLGMQFGLWFGPDSADDFANWQRDAAVLLDYHRRLGINYFKIDGVKARTRLGEQNLHRFFDKVLRDSAGAVTFDFDITAETRPSYFSLMETGPLFVENRYTDFRRYWPHHTLRTLWRLAQYIDPLRLRMEFLNTARHQNLYSGDPLAPEAYRPEYLFASLMFCSPLGWFEASNLPAAYSEQVGPLASIWKTHRDGIFGGSILPLGDEPSGTGWTGFASISPDRRGGHLLLLRECNDSPRHVYELGELAGSDCGNLPCEVLAGHGSASFRNGQVEATIPNSLDYLLIRFGGDDGADRAG